MAVWRAVITFLQPQLPCALLYRPAVGCRCCILLLLLLQRARPGGGLGRQSNAAPPLDLNLTYLDAK